MYPMVSVLCSHWLSAHIVRAMTCVRSMLLTWKVALHQNCAPFLQTAHLYAGNAANPHLLLTSCIAFCSGGLHTPSDQVKPFNPLLWIWPAIRGSLSSVRIRRWSQPSFLLLYFTGLGSSEHAQEALCEEGLCRTIRLDIPFNVIFYNETKPFSRKWVMYINIKGNTVKGSRYRPLLPERKHRMSQQTNSSPVFQFFSQKPHQPNVTPGPCVKLHELRSP